MLRALLGGFLLLLAHAVETRAQNARAHGPAYWECLVSEEGMQPPWIVFNYKSKRTRCPRVGVSLECDVPSWHPSAPEESSRARRNLRQLFLHPRTANEEPDRMVKPEFWFMPLPSSKPRLPGAKWNGGSLGHDAVSQKSGLTILERASRATGKWGFYFVQIKHRDWISPRVCTCACSCSYEQIHWFSKGRFIK